jgi:hypothetical protein
MDGTILLVLAAGIGLMMGYWCGRWPYHAAQKRGRDTLGLIALITCSALGAVGGCVAAWPVALVFYLAVTANWTAAARDRRGYEGLSDEDYRRAMMSRPRDKRSAAAPYTLIGPLVVCTECGHGSSKTDGEVPSECPKCREPFRREPNPRPRKARRSEPADEVVDLTAAPRPR